MARLIDLVSQRDGYYPLTYRGQVFYAQPEATHIATDSDGEIHVFTSTPDRTEHPIKDGQEYPDGYFCHADGNEGVYVGKIKLYDELQWVISIETIEWGTLV